MHWLKINNDLIQSDCGRFRITRHSKGFTSWLKEPNMGQKRPTGWVKIDLFPDATTARKACEQASTDMGTVGQEPAQHWQSG